MKAAFFSLIVVDSSFQIFRTCYISLHNDMLLKFPTRAKSNLQNDNDDDTVQILVSKNKSKHIDKTSILSFAEYTVMNICTVRTTTKPKHLKEENERHRHQLAKPELSQSITKPD